MKASSELALDSRAWSASVRDVVNSIDDAGSTCPGECRHKYNEVSKHGHPSQMSLCPLRISVFMSKNVYRAYCPSMTGLLAMCTPTYVFNRDINSVKTLDLIAQCKQNVKRLVGFTLSTKMSNETGLTRISSVANLERARYSTERCWISTFELR